MRTSLLGLIGWACACLLCAGCSGKPPAQKPAASPGAAPPIAQTASDEFRYDDPCSLLEPAEAERVLGEPLGTPPYRSQNNKPEVDGKECTYLGKGLHVVTVEVDFSGGAQAFSILNFSKGLLGKLPGGEGKQVFRLDDGTEVTGEWDEATLMALTCCNFLALRGDQLLQIDFTGTDAKLADVVPLANAAFQRIDKPLKIDGGATIDAAKVFASQRPKPRSACELLTRAEIEAVVGKLATDPVADPKRPNSCRFELASGTTSVAIDVSWQGGYAAVRSAAHTERISTNLGRQVVPANERAAEKATPEMFDPAVTDPAWERGGWIGRKFLAVRRDVLVTAAGEDRQFFDIHKRLGDGVEKLVAAVLAKT